MEILTREDVTARVRKAVDLGGGLVKFAGKLNVTPEYVGHILNGKKPGPKVCKIIHVREITGGYADTRRGVR